MELIIYECDLCSRRSDSTDINLKMTQDWRDVVIYKHNRGYNRETSESKYLVCPYCMDMIKNAKDKTTTSEALYVIPKETRATLEKFIEYLEEAGLQGYSPTLFSYYNRIKADLNDGYLL